MPCPFAGNGKQPERNKKADLPFDQLLLAARISSEMGDLLQTAESLDERYLELPPDQHAVKRLAAMAAMARAAGLQVIGQ